MFIGYFTDGLPTSSRIPIVEVTLRKQVDAEINRLVEQDEFVNREQAIEGLLTEGLSVHESGDTAAPEVTDEVFTKTLNDQQDPALEDDQ